MLDGSRVAGAGVGELSRKLIPVALLYLLASGTGVVDHSLEPHS
jgi:hypothetical protein